MAQSDLETKAAPLLEFKFAADGALAGTVSGYAAIFGPPADLKGDVIAPGAFRGAAAPVPMLAEHRGAPIGEWQTVREDARGLFVEGRVNVETKSYADLKAGRCSALSIGYRARAFDRAPHGRVLKSVELVEISVTKNPANRMARVVEVKSVSPAAGAAPTPTKGYPVDHEQTGTAPETATIETKAVGEVVAEAVTAALAPITTRLDRLETVARRPGTAAVDTKSAGEIEIKAFTGFVRRGIERMDGIEAKSLRVSDDTAGGYLAPDQFVAEMIRNLVLFSPIRSVARVASTSAGNVILPRRTGTLTGNWTGETEDHTEADPTYGQAAFPVAERSCYVDVSNSLLEDSAFDIAGELAHDFAEEFGKAEGAAFVSGTGGKRPLGFLSDTSMVSVNSGDASAIKADGLIDLFHALPTFYAQNATWAMNRTTLGAVRKLKDGQGRYLVDIGGMGNTPVTTLLGRPVLECPDMPDVAGGAYPIVFGDFSNYRIFDRVSLAVLRDPYSVQTKGLVRFHARRRVAGGLSKVEAFRKLKISA